MKFGTGFDIHRITETTPDAVLSFIVVKFDNERFGTNSDYTLLAEIEGTVDEIRNAAVQVSAGDYRYNFVSNNCMNVILSVHWNFSV